MKKKGKFLKEEPPKSEKPKKNGNPMKVTAIVLSSLALHYVEDYVGVVQNVHRMLRPGGVFLIVNEVDGENPRDSRWLSVIDGMKIFNRSQFVTFLTEAGFSKVIVKRDAKRHWLCVLAIREDAGCSGNK